MTQLNSIPFHYKLTEKELFNLDNYRQLKNLLIKVYQDGRHEANLKRDEVSQLQDIAKQKWGFAATRARNIVAFFYAKTDNYYPTLPDFINTGRSNQNDLPEDSFEETTTKVNLFAYPNPAKDWLDLEYTIPEFEEGQAYQITIVNSAGQLIESHTANQIEGTLFLNTTKWTAGIYFAVLLRNNKQEAVYKIIIRK